MRNSPTARTKTRVEELIRRREALGWSVTTLAARAGIGRRHLYRVERGDIELTAASQVLVAETLGCAQRDLIDVVDRDGNLIRPFGERFDQVGAA